MVGDNEEIDPQAIVDAILDWRDSDEDPRGDEGDTEGEYYLQLDRPYRVKNGPFDTVEELLLVKGVTGNLLYGEDFDRNGLLTENENDGELTFPPDNEDDVLDLGLISYLTVHSLENNVSNDNRPRVYLLGEEAMIRAELEADFEETPEAVDEILAAVAWYKQANPTSGGGSNAGGGGSGGGGGRGGGGPGGGGGRGGGGRNRGNNTGDGGPSEEDIRRRLDDTLGDASGAYDEKLSSLAQSIEDERGDDGEEKDEELGDTGGGEEAGSADNGDMTGDGGEEADDGITGGEESDDSLGAPEPMPSPALLFAAQEVDGQFQPSPLSVEWIEVVMDRCTMQDPQQPQIPGLININTAPRTVLQCLDGLTDEQVEAILVARGGLTGEEKMSTGWLVTQEVLDVETFALIAPHITARGQQFTIDVLGFADHVGMVTRTQVVVDMLGPVAQTVYTRDLTTLGAHFPIREEDTENFRVR